MLKSGRADEERLGREERGSRLCSFDSSKDKLGMLNWFSSLW